MNKIDAKKALYDRVVPIIESSRNRILRTINQEIVQTYWEIGREIVEEEQQYMTYEIWNAVRSKLRLIIINSMKRNFIVLGLSFLFIFHAAVFAKPDKDDFKNHKSNQNAFRDDHPVFGDGKLHPVHDDKVIGKYKHNGYEDYKQTNVTNRTNTATISKFDRTRINNLIANINHLFDERRKLHNTKAKLKNAYSSSQTPRYVNAWRRYRLRIVNKQLDINRSQLIRAIDKLDSLSGNDSHLRKLVRDYYSKVY